MSFSSLPGNDPAVRMPARLAEPAGNPRVRCIGRLRDLQRYAAPLEALRLRSSDPGSVISLPEWLAARHVPEGWAARAILLHEDKQLEAALFLLEKTVAGISTGYFRGGDALGETLLLCEAGREEEYRTLILNLLLKRRRAFLVILDEPNESPTVAVASGFAAERAHSDRKAALAACFGTDLRGDTGALRPSHATQPALCVAPRREERLDVLAESFRARADLGDCTFVDTFHAPVSARDYGDAFAPGRGNFRQLCNGADG